MKRTLLMTGVLLLSSLVISQETIEPGLPNADPNSMNGQNGQGPCPMCMMKAQQIFQSQLVPLADGGVLLMAGGKLYKYDQNLNLVAQTELQIDYTQIQTQMRELMSSCPLCQRKAQSQWPPDAVNGSLNGQTNGQTNGTKEQPGKKQTETKTQAETKTPSMQ